jgi:molecular chaperone GrpE
MENEKESIVPSETPTGELTESNAAPIGSAASLTPVAAATREELVESFEKLRAEKDALYERLLRKQAELENFRKRMQREKEDFVQHATVDLVRALLPTLDGFDRALRQRDANVPEEFYQGLELIYKELLDVLARAGLSPIESLGKDFDPHLHQAVETVEAGGHRDQEIVEELQRGYKLKKRLLRPAVVKVAVASRPASAPASKSGEES